MITANYRKRWGKCLREGVSKKGPVFETFCREQREKRIELQGNKQGTRLFHPGNDPLKHAGVEMTGKRRAATRRHISWHMAAHSWEPQSRSIASARALLDNCCYWEHLFALFHSLFSSSCVMNKLMPSFVCMYRFKPPFLLSALSAARSLVERGTLALSVGPTATAFGVQDHVCRGRDQFDSRIMRQLRRYGKPELVAR